MIHSELMTHRVISRNASSSRAIPTAKLIEEVRSNALRASPVFWGENQKGMQAAKELDNNEMSFSAFGALTTQREAAKWWWSEAAHQAVYCAEKMIALNVHKQIVNRLLEPFSHINVVATATEWDNFFGLRLDKGAQPEMRALAVAVWEARKASTPDILPDGCWHLPFMESEDFHALGEEDGICCNADSPAIKVSIARCARVSYESFETGKRSTVEEDLKLYDRLVGSHPMHASPAEHQATPDKRGMTVDGGLYWDDEFAPWHHPKEHGNFVGWRQFRKMLPNETCAPLPEEFR